MIYKFMTVDYPDAEGNNPKEGDICYRVSIPLVDGGTLELMLGDVTRRFLVHALSQAKRCADEGQEGHFEWSPR